MSHFCLTRPGGRFRGDRLRGLATTCHNTVLAGPSGPMMLSAAAGAGIVLSAPAAALFVQPAVAQAAPDLPGCPISPASSAAVPASVPPRASSAAAAALAHRHGSPAQPGLQHRGPDPCRQHLHRQWRRGHRGSIPMAAPPDCSQATAARATPPVAGDHRRGSNRAATAAPLACSSATAVAAAPARQPPRTTGRRWSGR